MSKQKKPALTRRLNHLYTSILNGHYDLSWYDVYTNLHKSKRFSLGKSLNCWAALGFAKRWGGRNIDLKALERIVRQSDDALCIYEFARDIPGANIKRLQSAVITLADPEAIRLFIRDIPGANKQVLENILLVAEIMAM